MIVWLIGMADSGKTTLGRGLYDRLKPTTRHLVYLDGDEFRSIFRNDADHTLVGRGENAERISHFCQTLDRQGIHVIASVLSIFPRWQAWNRESFSDYFEIFLDIPLAILRARDTKGLYKDADAGRIENVVGVDIPFPNPPNPDLVISKKDQDQGVDDCLKLILHAMPELD